MEPLLHEPTGDTPKIKLDPHQGHFEFVGNSYPENTSKLYGGVIDWLDNWLRTTQMKELTVDFNFDYFNTSSAKYILEILRRLRDFHNEERKLTIRWHYYEDDTDMLESGEDYMETIDMDFELVVKEEDDF